MSAAQLYELDKTLREVMKFIGITPGKEPIKTWEAFKIHRRKYKGPCDKNWELEIMKNDRL